MFTIRRESGVTRLERAGTEWLSTGYDGGRVCADAAYNVTVPEGWPHQSLDDYVADRLAEAGFGAGPPAGPALLTGVAQRHLRGARAGSVECVATVGVSNPASLPADPAGGSLPDRVEPLESVDGAGDGSVDGVADGSVGDGGDHVGTVNVFVGTERALAPGALATALAMAVEARAVTLERLLGVPGTTSDAVVVGCDPSGDPARFAGSATRVGAAVRVCVRDAVTAALRARYADEEPPDSVSEARHGIDVQTRSEVFEPDC